MVSALILHDTDDASQISPLLDQITDHVASVTGTGVCDQKSVYTHVAEHHPNAAVIVPPRTLAHRMRCMSIIYSFSVAAFFY
jgi:hypothetical protein